MDQRTLVLVALAVVLLALCGYLIYRWMVQKDEGAAEGFTDVMEEEVPLVENEGEEKEMFNTSILDDTEKQLFYKLKNNKLSSDEIDRFIGSGVLTTDVMDRFLTILGEGPVSE